MGEQEPSFLEIEISDINPLTRRKPGGVWCEDVLPVTEWESAEHRVVLPEDLQRALGINTPVLRWSSIQYRSIVVSHGRDMPVIQELTRLLINWAYLGEETGAHMGQYRVLFRDDYGRWYAMTIGPDKNGSYNVITIFGGSDRGFLQNRLRHLRNIVKSEK